MTITPSNQINYLHTPYSSTTHAENLKIPSKKNLEDFCNFKLKDTKKTGIPKPILSFLINAFNEAKKCTTDVNLISALSRYTSHLESFYRSKNWDNIDLATCKDLFHFAGAYKGALNEQVRAAADQIVDKLIKLAAEKAANLLNLKDGDYELLSTEFTRGFYSDLIYQKKGEWHVASSNNRKGQPALLELTPGHWIAIDPNRRIVEAPGVFAEIGLYPGSNMLVVKMSFYSGSPFSNRKGSNIIQACTLLNPNTLEFENFADLKNLEIKEEITGHIQVQRAADRLQSPDFTRDETEISTKSRIFNACLDSFKEEWFEEAKKTFPDNSCFEILLPVTRLDWAIVQCQLIWELSNNPEQHKALILWIADKLNPIREIEKECANDELEILQKEGRLESSPQTLAKALLNQATQELFDANEEEKNTASSIAPPLLQQDQLMQNKLIPKQPVSQQEIGSEMFSPIPKNKLKTRPNIPVKQSEVEVKKEPTRVPNFDALLKSKIESFSSEIQNEVQSVFSTEATRKKYPNFNKFLIEVLRQKMVEDNNSHKILEVLILRFIMSATMELETD